MDKLFSFTNSFANYIMLMVVIIVVAALGFAVGSIIRNIRDKKKNTEVSNSSKN